MTYSPPNENTKPLMITLLLTVMSVFSMMFASQVSQYKWLLQLAFVCLATAAIQIFLKYVLTKFEYVCDSGSFLIYKSMGKRKMLVGNVPLKQSVSYVMTAAEYEENKGDFNVNSTYVYTRNMKAENVYYYISELGGANVLIKFECNAEFAKFFNESIDTTVKGNNDDDEI